MPPWDGETPRDCVCVCTNLSPTLAWEPATAVLRPTRRAPVAQRHFGCATPAAAVRWSFFLFAGMRVVVVG